MLILFKCTDIPHLKTVRIGTKAFGYWPYKFLTDTDAADTLQTFKTNNVKRDKSFNNGAYQSL